MTLRHFTSEGLGKKETSYGQIRHFCIGYLSDMVTDFEKYSTKILKIKINDKKKTLSSYISSSFTFKLFIKDIAYYNH